jgi:hypothetical protein
LKIGERLLRQCLSLFKIAAKTASHTPQKHQTSEALQYFLKTTFSDRSLSHRSPSHHVLRALYEI